LITDISFKLRADCIPVDHGVALHAAVTAALPFLATTPNVGIHTIYGAPAANGWQRPDAGQLLHLSRRARLRIRVPHRLCHRALALSGTVLDLKGHRVSVAEGRVKALAASSVLFSRYVLAPNEMTEQEFLAWARKELAVDTATAPRLICGRQYETAGHSVQNPARSLLVADLGPDQSLALQARGLGPGRLQGCGLFIPHKSIAPVRA